MSVNGKSVSIYDTELDKNMANHVPLSPINFLRRSAAIYPTKTAVVYETLQFNYQEFYDRCCGLACALMGVGVAPGETVAVMAPNVPAMLECHYGVPMAGAVLNSINTRLDASTIAFILEHSAAKVFIVDSHFDFFFFCEFFGSRESQCIEIGYTRFSSEFLRWGSKSSIA